MRYLIFFISTLLLFGCSSMETPFESSPTTAAFRGPKFNTSSKTTSLSNSIALEWPVPVPAYVTQRFKAGSKRIRHQGLDIGGARGTSIMAAHEGTVIYVGRDFRGFGKMIILENPQGYATFYAHLNSIMAKEGQYVPAGKKIGTMGRTGRATGVHLHFELRVARIPVDPLPYLPIDRYPASFK